jgi:hypothetical protein
MRFRRRPLAILAFAGALLLPSAARAQWVFVARKALGKIQTMSQKENTGTPGYSVATVILEGNADKVFATAVKSAESAPKARLTHQDPAAHTLEFIVGGQVAGLRVSQVDSEKVQILIVSAASPGKPDATPAVVEATLRVCKEMGAVCEEVR